MRPSEIGAPGRSSPAGWLARGAMVFGSVAMALRLALPRPSPEPQPDPAELDDTAKAGRGIPGPAASPAARRAGHETADMSATVMARYFALLAVVAVTVVLGMSWLSHTVATAGKAARAKLTVQQLTHPAPPAPGLQSDPVKELADLRGTQGALLHGYAWLGDAHDRARIPVDRAMALMVGHPLDTAP